MPKYFNPRAPCGARQYEGRHNTNHDKFQPTRPLRGATIAIVDSIAEVTFQPTRPLRGATNRVFNPCNSSNISTHAPLAGRDRGHQEQEQFPKKFQPTRPLRGATTKGMPKVSSVIFQPTRPLRGATEQAKKYLEKNRYFNPRAPCGARPFIAWLLSGVALYFNPRAPCGARPWRRRRATRATPCNFNPRAPCGARQIAGGKILLYGRFQPTRPLRGATA